MASWIYDEKFPTGMQFMFGMSSFTVAHDDDLEHPDQQTKIMKYIKFASYQGNCGFDQSMCQIDFMSTHDNSEVLRLKMHTIGSTPVQIITHH
jgi:hypothetical protein